MLNFKLQQYYIEILSGISYNKAINLLIQRTHFCLNFFFKDTYIQNVDPKLIKLEYVYWESVEIRVFKIDKNSLKTFDTDLDSKDRKVLLLYFI